VDPTENKTGAIGKIDKSVTATPFFVRWLLGVVYWCFPLALLGIGYLIGIFVPAFRESVFSKWPIDEAVWIPLVVLIMVAGAWLLFDLFWVVSRETTSRNLQANSAVTNFIAIILSVAFGYSINSEGSVRWWFVVPFVVAVVNVFTTAWAAINNATQKPFMSEPGKE
jgi:hypothetical protein